MVHYTKDGYLLCNGCALDAERDEADYVGEFSLMADSQTKCAGCGLKVDPQTGKHIDEVL